MILFYTFLLLYFERKINAVKANNYRVDESKKEDKLNLLYRQIIIYLETEKAYQDPKFSKNKLAEILKTNETYVSKALNKVGNKNFNYLINEYRINQVKEEFLNNNHKKFTVEHIYTKAGFTQQSTFNRVFKEFTKITPTEFIDNIKNDSK